MLAFALTLLEVLLLMLRYAWRSFKRLALRHRR
jgi:hypothetical protein